MLQPIKDEQLLSLDRSPVKTYYLVGKGRGILFWRTPEVKIEERETGSVTSKTEMLVFSLLFTLFDAVLNLVYIWYFWAPTLTYPSSASIFTCVCRK